MLQVLRLHLSGMQHNAIIVIVTAIIMQNQENNNLYSDHSHLGCDALWFHRQALPERWYLSTKLYDITPHMLMT